jgi:ABC-type uncharacterized transport system involved in gliding motility auxiliary subunit
MRHRVLRAAVAILAVAAIVVGANLFADAQLADRRIDLTAQRLYTLSPGTRQILAGLKEPVTLRLFYSRKLGSTVPAYGTMADHVRETLAEYANAAHGNLRLEFFDPEPFSETEDRAMAYGLQGVPLDQAGEQVYFGLVGTNLLDDERSISFFQPERERFLEYDLTRLIYELSNPKRPVLGVISALPLDGDPRAMMARNAAAGRPFASMLTLRQTNLVQQIAPDAQIIPAGVDVLLVAAGQKLSDTALYAIDQFVMRGGRLMAMTDPYSETLRTPPGTPPAEETITRLLDKWGIGTDAHYVVGDPTGAWRVRAGERSQATDYLPWFNIRDGIARDDPATADLTQVTVASAGALTKKPGAAIDFIPLLKSSPRSGLIAVEKLAEPNPAAILADFTPEGGERVIAARVRGKLHSAFDQPPPLAEGQTRPENFPAHRSETEQAANLVVVADADLLADRFWVQQQDFFGQSQATPFSDNGPFVANLIDTLAGGDALIGLRSRGDSIRPFDLVRQMQSEAEAKFRQSEKALQQRLEATEKKLRELRSGTAGGAEPQAMASAKPQATITIEQRAAIDAAREEIADTRQKLRLVNLELNRDISALQTWLKLADIVLVPALLALLAIAMGLARRRRRARART